MTDSPLDDFRDLVRTMPKLDLPSEINPDGSLPLSTFGRLDRMATWISASQRRDVPKVEKTTLALFAGSHGLAKYGISVSASDATLKRIEALREGKTPTNGVAADARADVKIFELGLDVPTKDISVEPAMSEKECAATLAFGMEAVADSPDCLALGVLAVGGGTAAAAVAAGLYGGDAQYWVRAGQGVSEEVNLAREGVVKKALYLNRGHLSDPLEVLRRLGGRELTACVGAIVAARHQGVPVLLDSFATAVAAAVIYQLDPSGLDHVVAAQVTDRPSHKALLERIHLDPLLDLQLQKGDGYGSVLAVSLLRAACVARTMS